MKELLSAYWRRSGWLFASSGLPLAAGALDAGVLEAGSVRWAAGYAICPNKAFAYGPRMF